MATPSLRAGVLASLLATSCGGPRPPAWTPARISAAFSHVVLERAAFELECPAERLVVTPLGDGAPAAFFTEDRTVGVSGCDRKAVYVARCSYRTLDGVDVVGMSCVALLNSDERREKEEAPPTRQLFEGTPDGAPR